MSKNAYFLKQLMIIFLAEIISGLLGFLVIVLLNLPIWVVVQVRMLIVQASRLF